jgi:hypothetical protein
VGLGDAFVYKKAYYYFDLSLPYVYIKQQTTKFEITVFNVKYLDKKLLLKIFFQIN